MADFKATLLIVDDEPSVLKLCSGILAPLSYQVLTAPSGYAAYSLLNGRYQGLGQVAVDLVLTDWKMEGWDGIRLLGEIRSSPFRDLPVLLMSGAVTRSDLLEASKQRNVGIYLKPIQKDSLISKVEEVLTAVRA